MDAAGWIPGESSIRKGRLTAAFVRSVVRPGVYGDEHGLPLRVAKNGLGAVARCADALMGPADNP